MAITDHAQDISIYQKVLDRLPFIIDDSGWIFDTTIAGVNPVPINTLEIDNDWIKYIYPAQVHTVVLVTPIDIKVAPDGASYDIGTNTTTISYLAIQPATINIGDTLRITANKNEQLISRLTYQVMVQLQACLDKPDDELGDEQYYTEIERSLIAALVAYYVILIQIAANSGGGIGGFTDKSSSNINELLYVKSAKAGEVSTSWDIFNVDKSSALSMNAEKLIELQKADAICIGRQLGCLFEVCEDGTLNCSCSTNSSPIITNGFILADSIKHC